MRPPPALLLLAASLSACSGEPTANAVLAMTDPSSAPERARGYLRADANGDRVVTREEILAEAEARFRSIDTDGDGTVSSAKLSGRRARALGSSEEAARVRPPEPVTLAAFRDRALARFDRRDLDDDGRLEGAELTRRVRRRLKRPGAP